MTNDSDATKHGNNTQPCGNNFSMISLAMCMVTIIVIAGIWTGVSSRKVTKIEKQKTELQIRLKAAKEANDELLSKVSSAKSQAKESEEEATRLRKLYAKAPVPSFVGKDSTNLSTSVSDDMEWTFATRKRPTRASGEGTVVAQKPKPGTKLGNGARITVFVATTPPKAWITTKTFKCQGGTVKTDPFTITDDARMKYTYSGSSNSTLWLYPVDGGSYDGDLIVNEIGATSGTTRVYDTGRFYLEISGDSCTVTVQQFR